jgi:tetratricopeptide (TPR) repeat protein
VTPAAQQLAAAGPRARQVPSRRLLWGVALALAAAAIAGGLWWQYGHDLQEDPLQRGLAALERGEFAAARHCVTELRALDGHESQATFLRGAMLVKMGYYYPGLDDLDKVQHPPELKQRSLILMGEAWYYLGRHVEAQAALRQVVESDPAAIDAHRWLASSYYDMGAITDALVHLQRTAELDPADHRPQRLIGLIYKDFERYEDAAPMYEESLRRKGDQPDWAQVRQELAACQLKLRRHQDALATLKPCPQSPAVLVLQAECLHALGKTAAAKEAVQTALDQEPQNLEALVLLGSILLEEGSINQAIDSFERAAKNHPKDYMAHFKLAQAYAQANRPEMAAAEQKVADHLREVRKLFADLHQAAWNDPQDARVRLRLAQLAKELDRPDLEQVWLKAAAALQSLPDPEGQNE